MSSLVLIFLAAIFDAERDKIQFNPKRTIFPSWDFWVVRNYHEKQGAGWLFDNLLSFANDGWHLCKWMVKVLFILAIVAYEPLLGVWDILLFLAVHNIAFEVFYKHI